MPPGLHTNTGAKRAREAREELGLDPAAPIDCVLSITEDDFGIPVNVSTMPDGVEGQCWQADGTRMLWVNAHEYVPRRRFTLAHELGHLRCGHDGTPMETYKTVGGKVTTTAETQANAFAAEFLVPRAGIEAFLASDDAGGEPTLERICEMANHFRVSAHVAAFRLVTVGILGSDDAMKQRLADNEHLAILEALDAPEHEDGLAAVQHGGPARVSPLLDGGGLAAVLRGEATADEVAARLNVPVDALRNALARLGL